MNTFKNDVIAVFQKPAKKLGLSSSHVEYLYNAEGQLWQVIDKLDSTASPRIIVSAA